MAQGGEGGWEQSLSTRSMQAADPVFPPLCPRLISTHVGLPAFVNVTRKGRVVRDI